MATRNYAEDPQRKETQSGDDSWRRVQRLAAVAGVSWDLRALAKMEGYISTAANSSARAAVLARPAPALLLAFCFA